MSMLDPHHQSMPASSSARLAQEEWALTTFAERKRVLACLQRYILDNQDDIARVASRDSGKPGKAPITLDIILPPPYAVMAPH